MMNVTPETILLVEDNDDDVFIFERAYKQAQLRHPLQIVRDGQEALDYLFGEGGFADRERFPLPFLVLLDLKLPLTPGLEVLEAMRARPALSGVPVVVLTSSAEMRDVHRARELGAQAFLVKPPVARMLSNAVAAMQARIVSGQATAMSVIEGDMFSIAAPEGLSRPAARE
jgi:CheY-like chemotaxis protein